MKTFTSALIFCSTFSFAQFFLFMSFEVLNGQTGGLTLCLGGETLMCQTLFSVFSQGDVPLLKGSGGAESVQIQTLLMETFNECVFVDVCTYDPGLKMVGCSLQKKKSLVF